MESVLIVPADVRFWQLADIPLYARQWYGLAYRPLTPTLSPQERGEGEVSERGRGESHHSVMVVVVVVVVMIVVVVLVEVEQVE